MTSFTVATSGELSAAIGAAHAGDSILLAAGVYSGLTIKNLQEAGTVTIASADSMHQAVITDLNITNSKGFAFSGLEFSRDTSVDPYAFRVDTSSNIAFSGLNVHGTDASGLSNAMTAFLITKSTNVSISGSEFQKLANGVVFSNSSGLNLADNTFHNIGIGGIRGAAVNNVQITGNTFTDFHVTNGNHPDAIQFFTAGTTTASHDILVSDNVYLRGNGDPIQGIFFRDTVGGLTYSNITVHHNFMAGSMYNGILVEDAKGVDVSDNTVLAFSDMAARINLDTVNGASETNNTAFIYVQNAVTNLIASGNVTTAVVTDGGAAALAAWQAEGSGPSAPTPGQTIMGTSANEMLFGGAGNDTINGCGGADTLSGGAGDDTYVLPNSLTKVVELPGGGVDTVIARGDAILAANVENLTINDTVNNSWAGTGNDLNNVIIGNRGDNVLSGMAGDDTITGGAGNDQLWGGAGSDRFVFGPGSGHDVVADFGVGGTDSIDISAYLSAGLTPLVHDVGSDVVISFTTGEAIKLMGVHAASLHATVFGFTS